MLLLRVCLLIHALILLNLDYRTHSSNRVRHRGLYRRSSAPHAQPQHQCISSPRGASSFFRHQHHRNPDRHTDGGREGRGLGDRAPRSRARFLAVRYVFEPAPPLAMPAAERHPPPLLLFLPSLLLISCLDGVARAAAALEEGGGLTAGAGDPSGTYTAASSRAATLSALSAGKHKQRGRGCLLEDGGGGCHCY